MKKTIVFLFIMLNIFTLTACQTAKSEKKEIDNKNNIIPVLTEEKFNANINSEDKNIKTKDIETLQSKTVELDGTEILGMISIENRLICVDNKNGCLLVIDQLGQIIKKIGKLGSAPGEFQNPTGITKNEKYIYILDDGNNRIQILDFEFNSVQTITIDKDEFEPQTVFQDIAVDAKGNIYVAGGNFQNPGIVYFDAKSQSQHFIDEKFCGLLESYKGEIYAINSGQLYVSEYEEQGTGYGIGTGSAYLLKVSEGKMEKLCHLQGKNSIDDFMIIDDMVYCTSQYYNELQIFNLSGSYKGSLGQLDAKALIHYINGGSDKSICVSNANDTIIQFGEE